MNKSSRIAGMAAGLLAAFLLFVFVAAVLATAPETDLSREVSAGGVRFVAPAGNDMGNDCLDPDLPCQTVQYAIDQAIDGEEIRIAAGDYTENVVVNKEVILLGGFEAGTWLRDPFNFPTVLDGSANQLIPGDWDGAAVSRASVISDTSEYRLWYDGEDVFGVRAMGLATSQIFGSWIKHPANPVLDGDPGAWDETGEHAPFVIKDGATYKMWYEGEKDGVRQLGYATSPDGVTWNKFGGNPVLAAGPDLYDQEAAGHAAVLKEGGTYRLWYHAIGDLGPIIAAATSPNGTTWTKQGPVLLPDPAGWDDLGLFGPSVLNVGGTYWMWYAASSSSGPPAIGVVTSTNGIDWNRFLPGPVLSDPDPIGYPHVLFDGSVFGMWYTNFQNGTINYAESVNGINWTPFPGNPVLGPGMLLQAPGLPVVQVVAANVQLDGLTIRHGLAEGAGGVSVDIPGDASFALFNCRLESNQAAGEGGGAGLAGRGQILVENSRFINNQYLSPLPPGGPGAASALRTGEGMLTIVNTLITGNVGDAAIHVNNSLLLQNVSLIENDGDIIFNPVPDPGTMTIENSILFFNRFGFLGCPAGSTCEVTYSDIEGGYPGTGNIDADPLFAADGWHLTPASPALDAGSNTNAPPDDLEFDPRPVDGDFDGLAITDMGADEFIPANTYLPIMLLP